MRQALNSNPVVQLAVIGVLVVVVGLFLMMNLKKKSPSGAPADAPTAAATAPSTSGGTTPSLPSSGTASAGAVPTAGAAVAPTSGSVTPDALTPGPGLPRNVVKAWTSGDAVVLLVVRGGGIDDRLVRRSVDSLSSDSAVSVFVTRAKDVARYSRITQGVGVDRAPALVVVRSRKESGPVPEAQVSYGFRSSQSVVQAVHDALYQGRDDLPYSPR